MFYVITSAQFVISAPVLRGTAVQLVCARATYQGIASGIRAEVVIAAPESVIALAALEGVGAVVAGEPVVMVGTSDVLQGGNVLLVRVGVVVVVVRVPFHLDLVALRIAAGDAGAGQVHPDTGA